GVPLTEQRIAILGAGSAGIGIANLLHTAMVDAGLSAQEASRRFYLIDRDGMLIEGMQAVASFAEESEQPRSAVAGWALGRTDRVSLLETIYNAKPTALIGVSGQAGAFTESVVRAMAKLNKRPIIFPLSNPTPHAEAKPADVDRWSDGRAIVSTGSPFP